MLKFSLIPIVLIGLFFCTTQTQLHAQASCEYNRGMYFQFLRAKMYTDAHEHWVKALATCDADLTKDPVFLKNGCAIYYGLLREGEDEIRSAEINDTIDWIFSNGLSVINEQEWKLKYADFLFKKRNEKWGLADSLYATIHTSQEKTPLKYLKHYNHFLLYFLLSPSDGKDSVKMRRYINAHLALGDYALKGSLLVEEKDSVLKEKYDRYQQTRHKYAKYFIRNCNTLADEMGKRDSTSYLSGDFKFMSIKNDLTTLEVCGCESYGFYLNRLNQLVKSNATPELQLKLADVALKQENYPVALEGYLAVIVSTDSLELIDEANYKLAVAYYQMGEYRKAFYTSEKVKNKDKGKALQLQGDCVAAKTQSCGDSTFERKANYWLANDFYKKAIAHGQELNANKYLKNAPTKEMCFQNKQLLGSKITLACWSLETIVRYSE